MIILIVLLSPGLQRGIRVDLDHFHAVVVLCRAFKMIPHYNVYAGTEFTLWSLLNVLFHLKVLVRIFSKSLSYFMLRASVII